MRYWRPTYVRCEDWVVVNTQVVTGNYHPSRIKRQGSRRLSRSCPAFRLTRKIMDILPIPKRRHMPAKRLGIALMYDPDTGVGTLKPSTDFMENDLMLQVDCLREWIYDLEQIHDIGAELLSSGKSVYSRGLFKELYDERTGKIKQF